MPQSKKDMKKLKAKQDLANGVAPFDKKADKKKGSATCSICKRVFIVTARGIDIKQHVESNHSKEGLATCFPGLTLEA